MKLKNCFYFFNNPLSLGNFSLLGLLKHLWLFSLANASYFLSISHLNSIFSYLKPFKVPFPIESVDGNRNKGSRQNAQINGEEIQKASWFLHRRSQIWGQGRPDQKKIGRDAVCQAQNQNDGINEDRKKETLLLVLEPNEQRNEGQSEENSKENPLLFEIVDFSHGAESPSGIPKVKKPNDQNSLPSQMELVLVGFVG